MKVSTNTSGLRGMKTILSVLTVAASTSFASAQITGVFTETFAGPMDNPTGWITNTPANHFGIVGGEYLMSDQHSSVDGSTELRRNVGGSVGGGLESHITLTLNPHETLNTKTDFAWRFFGPNGFIELVYNGFGTLRVFHANNEVGGGNGNIVNTTMGNVAPGYSDGDTLDFRMSYDSSIDTIAYSVQVNGGPDLDIYSGGGNGPGGTFGDVFTGQHDVKLFKFGSDPVDQTLLSIDFWELSIPEPTSAALVGIGGLALMMWRRRR